MLNKLKKFYRFFLFKILCLKEGININAFKFIGVTGSSGKTTTSTMIYHLLRENNFRTGLISTVGVLISTSSNSEEMSIETGLHVTTPDIKDLVSHLKEMQKQKVQYIVLEASSHALAQGRVGSIEFEFAVFTNITSDHLDWHKTWENYASSKSLLISKLKKGGLAIINKDDNQSYKYLLNTFNNLSFLDYSLTDVSDINTNLEGVSFKYKNETFNIKVLGDYNISNALASIKVLECMGVNLSNIKDAFSNFKTVEGRMEVFQLEPFAVVLDFAHNADSLKKSLQTAKNLTIEGGRLISIFGSAGLRDIKKRYEMGKVSGEIADITIIVPEDPRTESLSSINSEILRGAEEAGAKLFKRFSSHSEYLDFINKNLPLEDELLSKKVIIFDEESVDARFDGIAFAVKIAKTGDVIIPNGKGHEKSLAFGLQEFPFSDREAIEQALST